KSISPRSRRSRHRDTTRSRRERGLRYCVTVELRRSGVSVLVLLDDVLFLDHLGSGLLDVGPPIWTDVHVGRLVDRLVAPHGPLLDDFFLFHDRPPSSSDRSSAERLPVSNARGVLPPRRRG